MKVLFVANKYFSRYKHFCVALKSYLTSSFEFIEEQSVVKPNVSWADMCKFTKKIVGLRIFFFKIEKLKREKMSLFC